MRTPHLYEKERIPDPRFPITVFECRMTEETEAFSAHWHEPMELLLVHHGSGHFLIEGEEVEAAEGDLVLINSGEVHGAIFSDAQVQYTCVGMDANLFRGLLEGPCEQLCITPAFSGKMLFQHRIPAGTPALLCLQELVDTYYNQGAGYALEVKALAFRFLSLLFCHHVACTLSDKELGIRIRNRSRMAPILDKIHQNYTESVDSATLASLCGLTHSHFCNQFKAITGQTVTAYVNRLRLDQADQLLLQTDLFVTEIAGLVGFDDVNYFCRMYRKYRGQAPRDRRRGTPT